MEIRMMELERLKRPEDSKPPDDRNFGDSYRLEPESLECLRPGEWLDDRDVNCFFRSLCLARPGEFVTFDSTALDFLLACGNATAPTQSAADDPYQPYKILAATVTGNRGLVFMPFCVRHHWILAVADFQHQVIRMYDSLVERDEKGRLAPSSRVYEILPHVLATLSFCIEEAQWQVELMWLPIQPTATECGVYICLMALQHSYQRRFRVADYIGSFPGVDGNLIRYELDECYWMVGRMIILQVCKRYLRPSSADAQQRLSSIEQGITEVFREHYLLSPTEGSIHQRMQYFVARSLTIQNVGQALEWAIDSIGNLDSELPSEFIQRRARQVVLTPPGKPFLNEAVKESIAYAWHDGEALGNLDSDLRSARIRLGQEEDLGWSRVRAGMLWEDWRDQEAQIALKEININQARGFVTQVEGDTSTGETPSDTEYDSPCSFDMPDEE